MADIKKLSPKNGRLLIISSVLLIITIAVSITAAYLHEKTNEITNTFIPATVACEVEEKFDGVYKTSVMVKVDEKSGTNAYVRLSAIGNKIDESGNPIADFAPAITINDTKWVLYNDGYYYYTDPVAPGGTTGELIKGFVQVESDERIDICAEAIQATEGATATAWGVVFINNNDGTITVKESGN